MGPIDIPNRFSSTEQSTGTKMNSIPGHPELEKKEIYLLAALLAIVIARTWVTPMFSSLWVDEWATYLIGSEGPARIDALANLYISDQRLIGFAGWLGTQAVGVNEFGLRLYSLLAGTWCLFVIYKLGRRWFGARTALLSVLMFPCLHAVYQQSANARAYMLGLSFFLTLLWSVELWLEHRRWYWMLLGVVSSYFMVYTHLLQAIGLGVAGLRVLWEVRPWTHWWGLLLILLSGLAETAYQLANHPVSNLVHAARPTPIDFMSALFPQPAAGLVVLVLAALLGLRLAAWGEQKHAALPWMQYYVLAAWILPVLGMFLFSRVSGTSVFIPRYYFIAFPGAAWLLGLTLARIEPFRWRAASVILIAASSTLILTGTRSYASANHENWRDAFATIDRLRSSPAEPVLFYSGFLETDFPDWRDTYRPGGICRGGLLFYHFDGNIVGLPYTAKPDRIAELRPQLEEVLASNRRVWLLSRDQSGSTLNWLDAYLAVKGWKARSVGFFDPVRVDIIEPDPAANQPAGPAL